MAGGIESTVNAISAHIDNANICKLCCGSLCVMVSECGKFLKICKWFNKVLTAEGKMKAATAGGIEVVIKAISRHINDAHLCCIMCRAFFGMVHCCGTPQN